MVKFNFDRNCCCCSRVICPWLLKNHVFSVSGLLKENTFTQISEILVFCFRKLKVKFDFVRNCFCRWRVICPWLLENLVFFFISGWLKENAFRSFLKFEYFLFHQFRLGVSFFDFLIPIYKTDPIFIVFPPLSRGRHVVFILSCPLVCHRSCEHEFLDTLCWIEIILDPFNYHDVKMCLSFVFFCEIHKLIYYISSVFSLK